MNRERHRRAVYILGFAKRNKRAGTLMCCSGPECGGAEIYAPGLSVADVLVAVDEHIDRADAVEPDPAPVPAPVPAPDPGPEPATWCGGPLRPGEIAPGGPS